MLEQQDTAMYYVTDRKRLRKGNFYLEYVITLKPMTKNWPWCRCERPASCLPAQEESSSKAQAVKGEKGWSICLCAEGS
jgi:hypothetical protein